MVKSGQKLLNRLKKSSSTKTVEAEPPKSRNSFWVGGSCNSKISAARYVNQSSMANSPVHVVEEFYKPIKIATSWADCHAK